MTLFLKNYKSPHLESGNSILSAKRLVSLGFDNLQNGFVKLENLLSSPKHKNEKILREICVCRLAKS
jgi:hypothetical protein